MYKAPHFWTKLMISWCFSLSLLPKKSQASRPVPQHHHPNQWHPCPERLDSKIFEKFLWRNSERSWSAPPGPCPAIAFQGRLVVIISLTCLNRVHKFSPSQCLEALPGLVLVRLVGQYQSNVLKCWTMCSSFNSALSYKLFWRWLMFLLSKVYASLDHYRCFARHSEGYVRHCFAP